ncbi:MAG: DNA repair protein RecO [Lentisphaeria bacterium]
MSELSTVEAHVLRKTPYSESSLVIATLSENGQQHFILRGALQTGKRRFPAVDLFRLIRVVYRPAARSDLHTAREAECLDAYSQISRHAAHYQAAGWLSRLVLDNSGLEDPMPKLHAALAAAFRRLDSATPAACLPIMLGTTFVLLHESGNLPAFDDQPEIRRQVEQMRECAVDPATPYPNYDAAVWRRLRDWIQMFLLQHNFKVPQNFDRIEL